MIDWFFDELPYWIAKLEYWIWRLTLLFIKYLLEGMLAIWDASKELIIYIRNKSKK